MRSPKLLQPVLLASLLRIGASCTRELPVIDDASDASSMAEPDHVEFDVAWAPDTVVVDEKTQRESELVVAGNTITIARPSDRMSALQTGMQLVVAGRGLFTIKTRAQNSTGTGLSLEVEQGSLLDAADHGHISWDVGLRDKDLIPTPLPDADPNWIADKKNPTKLEFSGMLGTITGTLRMKNEDNTTSLQMEIKLPTQIPFMFHVKADMISGRANGVYDFANGEVKKFQETLEGLSVEGEMSLVGGGQGFEESLEFPVGLIVPIPLGVMPAFIGITSKCTIRSTTSSKEQGKFVSKFRITGSTGVDVTNDVITPGKGLNSLNAEMFDTSTSEYDTVFTSAIGAKVELPRITFGVGQIDSVVLHKIPSIIPYAGLYFAVELETVQNVVVEVQNGLKKHCKFVKNNVQTKVGGEIRAFGLLFNHEEQLAYARGVKHADGPNCDVVKEP